MQACAAYSWQHIRARDARWNIYIFQRYSGKINRLIRILQFPFSLNDKFWSQTHSLPLMKHANILELKAGPATNFVPKRNEDGYFLHLILPHSVLQTFNVVLVTSSFVLGCSPHQCASPKYTENVCESCFESDSCLPCNNSWCFSCDMKT